MGLMGAMGKVFSSKGRNSVGITPVEQSPVEAFRLKGRNTSWGPAKLPEGGVHSTAPKTERVRTVNPTELGKAQAKAQQHEENAERWEELMKAYARRSDADLKEHAALRKYQKHEAVNHTKKLHINSDLAAFIEGQRMNWFQEDRQFEALLQHNKAMTDELQQWNSQMQAAINN
ncbi:hypothetical protein H6F90_29785 [Trichocoleus sp. FACHB-591]|uniref:hypothetical protein n=1 Tax=Trichocoleus sp. FACHB-591 TaxID=2692872 RepID=UPI0016867458|nr:hypothetical protein [Trichocoleus sp. FACHB-591]MBD2099258.1 hypothetical protein [Trichocoleus sp. FACHB-591]